MTYQLAADWSRTGTYDRVLEDVSAYVLKPVDIVASFGRAEPRATEDTAAGTMSFALRNDGREFSRENAGSPIAGKVLPGTPVRLQATDPADGSLVTVFEGPMDRPEVDPNAAGKDFSTAVGDGWGQPGDVKLSTQVYQGQRTGDLVNIILDLIGWPADKRSIDPGVTLVPYWWLEDVDAQPAITDLVHSEGPPAVAYVQNRTFYFRDRHHRVTQAASLTSQGTYTHTIPAGAVPGDHKILTGSFRYSDIENIVNSAGLEVAPWLPDVPQVVWSTGDPIVLNANETVTLFIRADDPFIDLQTPTQSFTYLDDGILQSDYSLAGGSISSITLSRTSGQSALLTITAGAGGAFLDQGINVRGRPLRQGASRLFTAADPVSQAAYGFADWGGSAKWAHFYDAQAIVNRVVSIYSQPQPSVTFDVDGILSPQTLSRILHTAISDRITVREDELGLSADFFVEKFTHTIRGLGTRHILTIGAQVVEPYQSANPFTFDVAGQGFDQGQFSLDAANNPATMFRFDVAGHGFDQGVWAS